MSYNQFNPETVLQLAINNLRDSRNDLTRLDYLIFRDLDTRDDHRQKKAKDILSLLRVAEIAVLDLLNNEDWSWSEEE